MNLAQAIFGPLYESFKDAQRVFIEQGGSPEEVKRALSVFKAAKAKKILKPEEVDIGAWIKQGWKSFKTFIDGLEARTSGRLIKREEYRSFRDSAWQEAIIHRNDEELLIVTPLTTRASVFFGSNTKWCTAATKGFNHFSRYVRENLVLFYVLDKRTSKKWAATWSLEDEDWSGFWGEDDIAKFKAEFPYDLTPYVTPEVLEVAGGDFMENQRQRTKFLSDVRGGKIKDLQGVDLRGFNLQGADLQGANLQGANLQGVDLQGAFLVGANLEGAHLHKALLKDANLQDANIRNATMPLGWRKVISGEPYNA